VISKILTGGAIGAMAWAAGFGVAAPAMAAPTFFAGTGHYYEFVAGSFTWTAALAGAATRSFDPGTGVLQGYLATVTSEAENVFLASLSIDGWLAGTDQVTEGTWLWAAGPETGVNFWTGGPGGSTTTFAAWNIGEPNNAGEEDHLHRNSGTWNDLPNGFTRGYYVEYGGLDQVSVPEPAALGLIGLGLATLGLVRRRSR